MLIIKTFAAIKDQIGEHIYIYDEPKNIETLSTMLKQKYPQVASMIDSSRFAVDMQIVNMDFELSNQNTIYLLPPSSGG